VAWSRQLNNRECFYGVRFEDLVERPQDCLEPILISAGLAWHEDCARELNQRFMASHQWAPCAPSRTLKQAQIEQTIDATPGLAPLMDELGYTAPRQFEVKQENDTNVWLAKKVRKAVKRYVRAHRR
jgi:hypothetical protein